MCSAPHPLLDQVWCERLPGHPGEHRAHLETRSRDMDLAWGEEPPAGDPPRDVR